MRRVSDVMTTDVVTVTKDTSCKEVARIMTERKVNALPVVSREGHVLGMVSEADVLRKQEGAFRRLGTGLPLRTRRERTQAQARNAAGLGGRATFADTAVTLVPAGPPIYC